MPMMWSSWTPGPEYEQCLANPRRLFVSGTHFHAERMADMPAIVFEGWRLKRCWHDLPGAVGTWLWTDALRLRSGSLSVWLTEEDMQCFVRGQLHRRTASRHRRTGTMTSTSWTVYRLDQRAIRAQATDWLAREAGEMAEVHP